MQTDPVLSVYSVIRGKAYCTNGHMISCSQLINFVFVIHELCKNCLSLQNEMTIPIELELNSTDLLNGLRLTLNAFCWD